MSKQDTSGANPVLIDLWCGSGYEFTGLVRGNTPMRPVVVITICHYNDVIMTTMASQITASRLFIQPFIQTHIKEKIRAPRHWPMCGEFTGDRWIPRTKGQLRGNVSIWWRHHASVDWVTITPGIGLSPARHQVITWTNDDSYHTAALHDF